MNPTNKNTAKINQGNHSHTSSGSTEAKKTSLGSTKTQQVQTSRRNISQDIKNAQSIIDAAPKEHRETMQSILNSKTHLNELIALAKTISDEKTQQRAWVIIANRENTPAHIRLEAAKNIQNDSIRKDLLKILAEDPTVNICLRLQAAQLINKYLDDNPIYTRLVIEASKEGRWSVSSIIHSADLPYEMKLYELQKLASCVNADELFAIIATDPRCSEEFRFEATQKIQDKITQQSACCCNISFFEDTHYNPSHKMQWLQCMTDEPFLHVKDVYLWEMINVSGLDIRTKIQAAKLLSTEEGQKAFIHLYNTIDSYLTNKIDMRIQLLSLIKDEQFLKEQEEFLCNCIRSSRDENQKIQAAKLLSAEDQPEAFLYICEHTPSLNTVRLKELFSRIPDEIFLSHKQAILKEIINNSERSNALHVAAVELMGIPYEGHISTIIKHPLKEPMFDNLEHLLRGIQLIEDKKQQEVLIIQLLSNFNNAEDLTTRLDYTLGMRDVLLKDKILDQFLQNLNDSNFPKSHVPHTIYCIYQNNPESLSSFEWNARTFIECIQSFLPFRVDPYFAEIINYIPLEQRDIVLQELFKNVNLLAIEQDDNFNSNDYRELFKNLHDLSSEDARETLLFAIAGNNNLEKNFRIQLIIELAPDDEIRDELLDIIKHSHEAQGGAIDPRRKHTTKGAR
jgi:hypothetical protein